MATEIVPTSTSTTRKSTVNQLPASSTNYSPAFTPSLHLYKTVDYLSEAELAVIDSLRTQFSGKKGRWTHFYKYITHVDANGDGFINQKEFAKCMKKVFKDELDAPDDEMITKIFLKIGNYTANMKTSLVWKCLTFFTLYCICNTHTKKALFTM